MFVLNLNEKINQSLKAVTSSNLVISHNIFYMYLSVYFTSIDFREILEII